MDFEFDEQQGELQRAARQILEREYPAASARLLANGDPGGVADRDLWPTLCSLDWPGLAIAPDDGGVGATAVELGIVIEALGYVADPTPFLATTTQFAPLVAALGSPEQRHRFLAPLAADGRSGAATCATLRGATTTTIRGRAMADGVLLDGSARFVLDGDRADEIAVTVDVAGITRVAIVERSSIRTERTTTFDPSLHLATVHLDGVAIGADRVLEGEATPEATAPAIDLALVGLALTSVGAAQHAFDMAVDYARHRHQFGVPIGSFQAIKHKAVDMYIALERARALGYFASAAIAEDDPRRSLAAAMAKAAAADAQSLVFRHGIQIFGGIGFTWENDLHLWLRRAKAASHLLGGATEHRVAVGRHLLAERRMDPTTEAVAG